MARALPEYPDSDFSDDEQSPLDVSFQNATEYVRRNTSKFNNEQLLELYGLYKQATEGKCDVPKPSWFDARGRKKWEAWREFGDMPSGTAKIQYVTLVQESDPNWCQPKSNSGDVGNESWASVSTLRGPNPKDSDFERNGSSLIDAAREDFGDRVSQILQNNPDAKYDKDEDGLTALHWAADRNATNSLKAALAGGCLIDAKDGCGQTALHYAVSCGHIDSTKILIEAGAALLEDEDGKTPLYLAEDDEIKRILEGAK